MFERLMEVIACYGALILVFVVLSRFEKNKNFNAAEFIHAQSKIWILLLGLPGLFYVLFGSAIW